jgi:hypothetical protein
VSDEAATTAAVVPAPAAPVISLPDLCLNCGTTLTGEYCSSCGQHAKHHVTSITHTAAELAEDLFHTDARVWRTLWPLLVKPGLLTVEYLRGKRVAYTPPFRLYIVLSLIFFLLPTLASRNAIEITSDGTTHYELVPEARTAIDTAVARGRTEAQRSELRTKLESTFHVMSPEDQRASAAALVDPCSLPSFEGTFKHRVCTLFVSDGGKNFRDELFRHVPQMLFALLPLVALFQKLQYLRSGRYYVEHLLFLVHFQAFFFLSFTLAKLIVLPIGWISYAAATSTGDTLGGVLMLLMPIYLFFAVRRVYGQSRSKSLLKTFLLCGAYLVGLSITFASLVAITALTAH